MTLDSKVIGFVVFVTGHARQDSCRWRSCRLPQSQHRSIALWRIWAPVTFLWLFFLVIGIHNSPRMASSSFAQRASWPLCSFLEAEIALSLSLSPSAVVPLSSALGYESVPEYFICRD